MTTEHKLIPDDQRHELKGASSASTNQVPHSNGDGTTAFKFVDYANLNNKPIISGYTPVFTGSSSASSQQPSATNTALQIEFGSAQAFTDVSISAAGAITFINSGQYVVIRTLRFSRTALTGVSSMFARTLINGTQSGPSVSVNMDNNLDAVPVQIVTIVDATAGQILTTEIVRDSSGVNVGGLFSATPTVSGWNISPSASVTVYKYRGTA